MQVALTQPLTARQKRKISRGVKYVSWEDHGLYIPSMDPGYSVAKVGLQFDKYTTSVD